MPPPPIPWWMESPGHTISPHVAATGRRLLKKLPSFEGTCTVSISFTYRQEFRECWSRRLSTSACHWSFCVFDTGDAPENKRMPRTRPTLLAVKQKPAKFRQWPWLQFMERSCHIGHSAKVWKEPTFLKFKHTQCNSRGFDISVNYTYLTEQIYCRVTHVSVSTHIKMETWNYWTRTAPPRRLIVRSDWQSMQHSPGTEPCTTTHLIVLQEMQYLCFNCKL